MTNRYDELTQLIKNWTMYLKLHRKVYNAKHMPISWNQRMYKIETRIENWKTEKQLIGELNS